MSSGFQVFSGIIFWQVHLNNIIYLSWVTDQRQKLPVEYHHSNKVWYVSFSIVYVSVYANKRSICLANEKNKKNMFAFLIFYINIEYQMKY